MTRVGKPPGGEFEGRIRAQVIEIVSVLERYFVQGKSIKEIARDLRLSRNTVRKVLPSDETSFSYARQMQPRRQEAARAGPEATHELTFARDQCRQGVDRASTA
jgi:predicted transcriptional regulator